MRVAECAGEEVAEAGVEDFEGKHGFPVSYCEADSVCVDGDDAGVHLLRCQVEFVVIGSI